MMSVGEGDDGGWFLFILFLFLFFIGLVVCFFVQYTSTLPKGHTLVSFKKNDS